MRQTFVAVFMCAIFGLALSGRASAQASALVRHQDHVITFDTPIALVNGVTLPAGTYLFSFPSPSQLGVTRITSQDRTKVYATLQTIPKQSTTSGFDVVIITEGGTNGPRTLKAWFCDASKTGHEFIAQK